MMVRLEGGVLDGETYDLFGFRLIQFVASDDEEWTEEYELHSIPPDAADLPVARFTKKTVLWARGER